jgi:hypothetical protein
MSDLGRQAFASASSNTRSALGAWVSSSRCRHVWARTSGGRANASANVSAWQAPRARGRLRYCAKRDPQRGHPHDRQRVLQAGLHHLRRGRRAAPRQRRPAGCAHFTLGVPGATDQGGVDRSAGQVHGEAHGDAGQVVGHGVRAFNRAAATAFGGGFFGRVLSRDLRRDLALGRRALQDAVED